MKLLKLFSLCLLAFSLHAEEPISSQEQIPPASPPSLNKEEPVKPEISAKEEKIVVKTNSIQVNDTKITYDSHTGLMTLKDENSKDHVHIFFTAYFVKNENSTTPRPLIFCFNGGPGSSSVMLHMGCFGPKKAIFRDVKEGVSPIPGTYKDNEQTLLSQADLVFIDPPSTGFSRPADGVDAKKFHGVKEDAAIIAEFTRHFLSHYKRWDSPLFILGESYGTVRAVVLADTLSTTHSTPVSGIILISSALDYETHKEDNDQSFALGIPTLSASAWYHKKLSEEFQVKSLNDLLEEVEDFVHTDLLYAYALGNRISPSYKKDVAKKLSAYTGISERYILLSNLRLPAFLFLKELLRSDGKVLGAYDTRFASADADMTNEFPIVDPSTDAFKGALVTAYHAYLEKELGWSKNMPYYALNRAVWPWKKIDGDVDFRVESYLNVYPILERLMASNQNLRIFVGSGLYDTVTPYYGTDYTFARIDLPEAYLKRIMQCYYEAGHMMYVDEKEHKALKSDVEQFLKDSLSK